MEYLGQVPVVRVEIPRVANTMEFGQNVVLSRSATGCFPSSYSYWVFSIELFDKIVCSIGPEIDL